MLNCPFVVTPLPTGAYEHCCPGCGQRVVARAAKITANCAGPSRSPALTLVAADLPPGGVGSELHHLLALFELLPCAGCQCSARRNYLDAMGPDWCQQHLDTILGWLREEAEKRGLPFVEFAARQLIHLAIRRARASALNPKNAPV
jgi:hypothetical protein